MGGRGRRFGRGERGLGRRGAVAVRVAIAAVLWLGAGCSLFVSDDFTKEPEAAGAAGASAGGAAGAAGGSADCAVSAPPSVACDPACIGVCDVDGRTCQNQCFFDFCVRRDLPCPEGLDCLFECATERSCEGSTIRCPEGHSCVVRCTGKESCRGTRIQGAATLQVDCPGESACSGAVIECGQKDCVVTLPSGGKDAPRVDRCPPAPCACPQP